MQNPMLLNLLNDPSATVNGWGTIDLFSATLTTNTTVTGATIDVSRASSFTIAIDVTGILLSGTGNATGATGLVYTLRGGQSGFALYTLRSTTAGLGQFAFKVAQAGVTTGATTDTTGVTRFPEMFLQVSNPATSTGGSVTVRAKVYTSPEF